MSPRAQAAEEDHALRGTSGGPAHGGALAGGTPGRGKPMDRAGQAQAVETPACDSAAGMPTGLTLRRLPTARSVAVSPFARHLALAICYLVAGVAVTWPRASYLVGRLPS